MRGFYGLIGAILGAFLGAAITEVVTTALGPDDISEVFDFMIFAPLGLLVGGGLGIVAGLWVLRYLQRPIAGRVGWTLPKVLLIVSLYLGLPILSVGMVIASITYNSTPPSDAAMIANFQRHKATFEELAVMTRQDKRIQHIGNDSTMPEDPVTVSVSPVRIHEYRRLFAIAGLKDGCDISSYDGATFNYWGNGSAISSDTGKNYAYLPKPPAEVQKRLDNYAPKDQVENPSYTVYRHIEGDWYLEYDCEPE